MSSANSTEPLRAHLHHLHILARDPQALAAFYEKCLGMKVTAWGDSWLAEGPNRRLVFSEGTSQQLRFVAYAVADAGVIAGLSQRLTNAGIAIETFESPWFQPGAVSFMDPDGRQFAFGLATAGRVSTQAGLSARLQHVVVSSQDSERVLAFFQDVVGFRLSDQVLDDGGRLRTGFLRSDHEHHSLAVFQASEARFDHHCYESSDWNGIRDWGDHFASMRLALKWGPGRHGPGNNLFVFVHDPEGNWIEISAELEIVAADRPVGVWPHEEHTLNRWGAGLLRS